jgi:hypothetical protein
MKQKYRIWKNVKGKELLIQEYAVLTASSRKQKFSRMEDEKFSLLCEQTYQADEVKKATSRGKDELILFLRNQHFFPIGLYMELIADAVTTMYASKGEQHEDLIFDDKEILLGALAKAENKAINEIEEDVNGDGPVYDTDDLPEDDSQISKDHASHSINQKQLDDQE